MMVFDDYDEDWYNYSIDLLESDTESEISNEFNYYISEE